MSKIFRIMFAAALGLATGSLAVSNTSILAIVDCASIGCAGNAGCVDGGQANGCSITCSDGSTVTCAPIEG